MSERKPGQEARDPASTSAPSVARRISLALQGGGAHGAFTWGVLDRLLQEIPWCARAFRAHRSRSTTG
jgi:hypothetical protein